MKITLYTITDCPFSKQEKEYLSSHQLTFEEKNLEANREFLTEMLAVSSNFAGTPVTKVEKDDGQIAVLKGFTKEEFDKLLGFSVEPVKSVESVPSPTPVVVPTPPVEVVKPAMPVVETPAPTPPPTPVVETPPAAPVQPAAPDPLANVLTSLEQQVNAVPTPPPVVPATPGMPIIPDPQL